MSSFVRGMTGKKKAHKIIKDERPKENLGQRWNNLKVRKIEHKEKKEKDASRLTFQIFVVTKTQC